VVKRCIVCGTLTDINNPDENRDKCQRCRNSTKIAALRKSTPVRSLFYIFEGFTFLFKNPKLFRLSVLPLLITSFVLFIMYGSFLYIFISGLNQYLLSHSGEGLAGFAATAGGYLLGLFGSLLAAILILFLFLPVSSIICIPFNDIISAETENLLAGIQNQDSGQGRFLAEVKVGVKEMFKLLFFKLVIFVLALPLLFVPVAGAVLFFLILSLVTAIDFLDIVMARKKFTLAEKLAFIKMNRLSFTMFSIPFLLLFWIPVIQIFIIPSATIAGTRFFLEAEKKSL
jgi:CysZ protein